MVCPCGRVHGRQPVNICAHRQGDPVLLQSSDWCVRAIYIHRIAPALCVGQPQQQRMEALVELLYLGGGGQYYNFSSAPTSLYT